MNKITKISFCFLSIVVIFISMCPLSAFASDSKVYQMPFARPTVTDHSGYIECLWENSSNGSRFVSVHSWSYLPYDNYLQYYPDENQISSSSTFPDIILSRTSGNLYAQFYLSDTYEFGTISVISTNGYSLSYDSLDFAPNTTSYTFDFSFDGYVLRGVNVYGSYSRFDYFQNYSNAQFSVLYSSESVYLDKLNEIIGTLENLNNVSGSTIDYTSKLNDIYSTLNSLDFQLASFRSDYSQVVSQILDVYDSLLSDLEDLISNTDNLEQYILDLYQRTGILLDSVTEIESWMYAFDTYLFEIRSMLEVFMYYQSDNNALLYEINSKLDSIISILQSTSSEEYEDFDFSVLEDFLKSEQDILDDSDVNASEVFEDVTLNVEAVSSVFGMFDSIVNVHPKIFGFIVLVLGLGLVALILGR